MSYEHGSPDTFRTFIFWWLARVVSWPLAYTPRTKSPLHYALATSRKAPVDSSASANQIASRKYVLRWAIASQCVSRTRIHVHYHCGLENSHWYRPINCFLHFLVGEFKSCCLVARPKQGTQSTAGRIDARGKQTCCKDGRVPPIKNVVTQINIHSVPLALCSPVS